MGGRGSSNGSGISNSNTIRKQMLEKAMSSKFKGVDEKQLALVDGAIHEAARLRAELDSLHEIVKRTGLLHYDANNPNRQKELPVSRMLPKVRAGYTNVIFKLSKVLGAVVNEDRFGQ